MSEEMLSSIRPKFKQLIADARVTFQGTRGARHGFQPWQKHHFLAKGFVRKIHKKKESTRRFLTASRTMKYFMQASSNISGRKNGANIWITSEQSTFARSLSGTIGTVRHVVSFSVQSETNGKRTHKKPSRLPSNYTSLS